MSVSATAPATGVPTTDRIGPALEPEAAAPVKSLPMFTGDDGGPSFWDFLDVINPLQHIPIVNTIYRELTGDEIGVGARLAGGTLFGGPVGLIASLINCAIEEKTGSDIGGHMLALFDDEPDAGENATALAKAESAAPDGEAGEPAPQTAGIEPVAVSELAPPAAPRGFSLSGDKAEFVPVPVAAVQPSAPPVALVQPSAPPAVATATEAQPRTATEAQPRTAFVAKAPRFMPVPNRTAVAAMSAPPPIEVPISVSGQRSNVPITGRNPLPPPPVIGPSPVAVQRALAQQGHGGEAHPALPTAETSALAGSEADWFSSAMAQGLQKYDRANRLGR